MNYSIRLLSILSISMASAGAVEHGIALRTIEANVVSVKDGDTIIVKLPGEEKTEEVRFVGSDTPEFLHGKLDKKLEANQNDLALVASRYVDSQMPPKDKRATTPIKIKLLPHRDVHKRLLGWVYGVDGKELGLTMVEKGLAVHYLYCSREVCSDYKEFLKSHRVQEYVTACHKARNAGLGIWAKKDGLMVMPNEYRKLFFKDEKTSKHIGDLSSKELVLKGVSSYDEDTLPIDYCDRILFDNKTDAKGYTVVDLD